MEPDATASTIISFSEKLEHEASKFYEKMAERCPENKEAFLAFSKESEANKVHIVRTYQETITDALEACFCFQGLNLKDYTTEANLTEDTPYLDALRMAIKLEKKVSKFYLDIAERCRSLLATIPNAFRKVAERRTNRIPALESLLDNATD
jgi:rubrerythrin